MANVWHLGVLSKWPSRRINGFNVGNIQYVSALSMLSAILNVNKLRILARSENIVSLMAVISIISISVTYV